MICEKQLALVGLLITLESNRICRILNNDSRRLVSLNRTLSLLPIRPTIEFLARDSTISLKQLIANTDKVMRVFPLGTIQQSTLQIELFLPCYTLSIELIQNLFFLLGVNKADSLPRVGKDYVRTEKQVKTLATFFLPNKIVIK